MIDANIYIRTAGSLRQGIQRDSTFLVSDGIIDFCSSCGERSRVNDQV